MTTLGTPEEHAASRHGMCLLASLSGTSLSASGASPCCLSCLSSSCAWISSASGNLTLTAVSAVVGWVGLGCKKLKHVSARGGVDFRQRLLFCLCKLRR